MLLQLCRLGGKTAARGRVDEKQGDMSNYQQIVLLALKGALGALGRVGWKK